ncbi:glycosyltransferase family 4 protein [Micromonospora sp. NBC_01813]|uniref:glycosyltransferase family 4 protein n=1 Tax=Micromonospora sp. NBC_01813 TaxID=2975988 RepID=UPI002DD8BFB6|nr:glycosyltransferase family 4 protein [Micromonospora sp. NBC_01813]WSA10305.1 glycosyltransferase family 4 protein [Micromonospora sp. NBC_01813]
MSAARGPLRVAYVLLAPPSYSETFITSEIAAVRSAGATVEVFAARRSSDRTTDASGLAASALRAPVRMVRHTHRLGVSYGPRAMLAASYADRLRPDVAAFAPDIIHAHFINLPTAVATLLAAELRRPVTAIAHAADFLLDRNQLALRRRLARLDHLFVISAATARQIGSRGVDMSTVPHSVVRAAFDGQLLDPLPRRAEPPYRLVTVARLVAKKGIGLCLDALAQLADAGLPVRYDVYGDGPLRGELTEHAARLGLTGIATFHGAVSHDVATAALAGADLAVLACKSGPDGDLDGIPVFLMEAGSRGVPVVSTLVSGIPELVGDGAGWLVRPDDPVALAGAIREAVEDPAESARRVKALRERIDSEFSPGLQAKRLLGTWYALASRADRPEASGRWD